MFKWWYRVARDKGRNHAFAQGNTVAPCGVKKYKFDTWLNSPLGLLKRKNCQSCTKAIYGS